MDKRTLLGKRKYTLSNGGTLTVPIYLKKTRRYGSMTARPVYGQLELYISPGVSDLAIDRFVKKTVSKYSDHLFSRPFLDEEKGFCYILGERKFITRDSKNKDNALFFYVSSQSKSIENSYKKAFLAYLIPRVIKVGDAMGQDLRGWKIYSGLYVSYYGVCFPTKQQMKFDYRLFAYTPYLSDAILYHEISHLHSIHHDEKFYTYLYHYCPDYDKREKEIERGNFGGETYGL